MKYRNLGKHGLKVSEISIGTMYHGSYFNKKLSHSVLKAAIDQGINYIDSADRYGIFDSELPMENRTRAEIVLGEFIKDYDRDDLVISSKLWYKMRESVNSGGLNRKHIRESIKESLKCLQTDYLDIYYCHRPDRETPLEETILTMSNLVDEGLINYWGTSWWPPHLVERTIGIAKLLGAHRPHVEQPPYHMFARFVEPDLFDVAKYHGMGIAAFEALATGLLSGKYVDTIPEDSLRAGIHNYPQEILDRRRDQMKKLVAVANSLDITMAQLALTWVLRREELSTTIMGASKPEQVVENAAAGKVRLSKDIQDQIEKILDNKPRFEYR